MLAGITITHALAAITISIGVVSAGVLVYEIYQQLSDDQ